jgi:hypothetical protein
MIEVEGLKVITRRPTDINEEAELGEDADDEAATPATPRARARALTEPASDDDIEPYQTPIALTPGNWKKNLKAKELRRRVTEETEEESSDAVEVIELREVKKNKVISTKLVYL